MAARRKAGGGGKKKGRGFLLLLLGLGIGVAAVFLVQLVMERNLHHTVLGWFKRDKVAQHDKAAKKEPEKPKSKFDFYTILPETETVLPERVKKEPKTAKTEKPEEGVSYILQAGSFGSYDEADQLKAKLALQGLTAQIQKISIEGKGEYYRVRLGPYDKVEQLDGISQQLTKMGVKSAMRLKVKKGSG